jgi:hypothetical protein
MQREITQEDLDTNPVLAELGAVVGSIVAISPSNRGEAAQESQPDEAAQ